jgi:hypothetical protein
MCNEKPKVSASGHHGPKQTKKIFVAQPALGIICSNEVNQVSLPLVW